MKSTKKRRCKRLAALVLALGVCVGAIPFTVLADENKAIDEQDGVEVTRIYDEGDIVPYSAPQTGTLYTLYTSSFPGGSPGYTNTWETLTVTVSHVMKVNGVYKAAYCLDKELGYQSGAAHQSGNNLDDFLSDKKEIIGYILANGFQWNSSDYWSQSDNDKWLATQLLIWAVKGHASISEKTHLIGVDKSVRDDIVKISSKVYNPNAFVAYYDSLVSAIENARKIPSFCTYPKESFVSGTKTVTIPAQTDNEIEIPDGSTKKLNDTNKVLSKWSSALTKSGLISGLAVAVNGNTISLTSNNAKGSATVEYKPNGGSGALLAWQYSPDPTSYQRFATYEPNLASVKAKLTINTTGQPATGDGMKIVKFSEDDIVAGMQFAVSGSDGSYRTFSTDSNGEIDLSELPVYEEIPVTDDDGNPVLDETTGEPLTTRGAMILYTAQEINVPDRYVVPEKKTFYMTDSGLATVGVEAMQAAYTTMAVLNGTYSPEELYYNNQQYSGVSVYKDNRAFIKIQNEKGLKLGVCYALRVTNGEQVYYGYTDPDGILALKDFDITTTKNGVELVGYFMGGEFTATEKYRGGADLASLSFNYDGTYFYPIDK